MNKDALLATAIGFVIGLTITGLLLVGPSLVSKLPKVSIKLPSLPTSQQNKQGTNPTQANASLTIDSPLNEAIESEKEILVSGKAKPNTTIVVSGPINDIAVLASDDGAYAGKISLVEGRNDITVIQNDQSTRTAAMITIFYTPESL